MKRDLTAEDERVMQDIYNHCVAEAKAETVDQRNDQAFMANLVEGEQGGDLDFEFRLRDLIRRLNFLLDAANLRLLCLEGAAAADEELASLLARQSQRRRRANRGP